MSTLLLVHSVRFNRLTDKAKQALRDSAGSSVRIRGCDDF